MAHNFPTLGRRGHEAKRTQTLTKTSRTVRWGDHSLNKNVRRSTTFDWRSSHLEERFVHVVENGDAVLQVLAETSRRLRLIPSERLFTSSCFEMASEPSSSLRYRKEVGRRNSGCCRTIGRAIESSFACLPEPGW